MQITVAEIERLVGQQTIEIAIAGRERQRLEAENAELREKLKILNAQAGGGDAVRE